MRQIINITESQLHNIVLEAARCILNESRSLQDAVSIFTKKYPNIDQEELAELMQADPTAVKNDRGTFIGKYSMWIGNQYVNGNIHRGDIPELRDALNTYNINKSQVGKGIVQYQSLDELVHDIAQYDDNFKAVPTMSKGEQGLEKVYEDDTWVVYIPHTYKASRKIGGNTHWCTASSDDYYFNYYKNKHGGEYYVNVKKGCMTDFLDKNDKFVKKVPEKYQFHFESDQFMDVNDNKIKTPILDTIGGTEGLKDFYKKIEPNQYFKLIYDTISAFNNGYAKVKLNHKWNWIDIEGNLLWNHPVDEWFEDVGNFKNGYTWVRIDDKCNFIDMDGNLVWNRPVNEWFDNVGDFINGYAQVYLNHKWNLIDKNGNLVWNHPVDEWFYDIGDFKNGYAWVLIDDKCNFIDMDGNLVWNRPIDEWLDYVGNFINGYAQVYLDHKWNWIDTKGNLVWNHPVDEWFDRTDNFKDGYAAVKLNGKYNFIDTNGNLYDENKNPIN